MQTTKELPACPVETTLLLIGDKWKVLILRDLMPGTKRFGELKKSIGSVSQKVLTAQLRDIAACSPARSMRRSRRASSTALRIWAGAWSPSWTPCGTGARRTRRKAAERKWPKKGPGAFFPRSSLPLTAGARLPMRTGRPGWAPGSGPDP